MREPQVANGGNNLCQDHADGGTEKQAPARACAEVLAVYRARYATLRETITKLSLLCIYCYIILNNRWPNVIDDLVIAYAIFLKYLLTSYHIHTGNTCVMLSMYISVHVYDVNIGN